MRAIYNLKTIIENASQKVFENHQKNAFSQFIFANHFHNASQTKFANHFHNASQTKFENHFHNASHD